MHGKFEKKKPVNAVTGGFGQNGRGKQRTRTGKAIGRTGQDRRDKGQGSNVVLGELDYVAAVYKGQWYISLVQEHNKEEDGLMWQS